MGEWPNDGKLSALSIRRACEDSLRRLQTDHIDLYQMHHVDRDTPWEEIWQAMGVLIEQGKVLYVGSSNFAGMGHRTGQRGRCQTQHPRPGQRAIDLQPHDTATIELEVLPAARQYGVGVIPWSPLQGGLLGGALGKEGRRRQAGRSREGLEANRRPDRSLREALRLTRREPGERRPRLAAPSGGGNRPNHRSTNPGTARRLTAGCRIESSEPTPSRNSTGSSRGTSRPPNTTPGRSTALIGGRQ